MPLAIKGDPSGWEQRIGPSGHGASRRTTYYVEFRSRITTGPQRLVAPQKYIDEFYVECFNMWYIMSIVPPYRTS